MTEPNFTLIDEGRAVPVAVTENEAVWPAVTVWLTGCVVMEGGTLTVRVAALLVTVPTELLTTTVNSAPLSEVVVTGVV